MIAIWHITCQWEVACCLSACFSPSNSGDCRRKWLRDDLHLVLVQPGILCGISGAIWKHRMTPI